MADKKVKTIIKSTIEDLVSDFLYYGRKEDDELPRGAIEEAVADGTITTDEIVETFKKHLERGLKGG